MGIAFGRLRSQYIPDPDQLTDYPRHASPDTASSRLSLDESIRSSLSAISQTSLISDYSYDANKKPTKKILKKSRRPHRGAKKNVHWNLNDSDTTSIDSFDSTSTTNSNLFQKAWNGVKHARQKWREFEKLPAPGSTGITPSKPLYPERHLSRPTSAPNLSPYKSSFVPNLEPTHEHTQSSSHSCLSIFDDKNSSNIFRTGSQQNMYCSSPLPRDIATSVSQNIKFERKVSPLTNIRAAAPKETANGFEILSLPSASVGRQHHADNEQNRVSPVYQDQNADEVKDSFNLSDDIDSFVLKLNDSKVAELEESTLEDRQRMHIFQFPRHFSQESSPASVVTDRPPLNSVRTAFLSDDDENDYDHLMPPNEEASKLETEYQGQTLVTNLVSLRTKAIDKSKRKKLTSYTDDDIEDALRAIDSKESQPPPIPKKRTRILSTEFPPSADKINLQRSGSDPSRDGQAILPTSILNKAKNSHHQKPPPVPPKIKRITSSETVQPNVLPNMMQTKLLSEENILPPPPEFAFSSVDCVVNEKFATKSDDILHCTSTSTLIAEPETSSNDITSSVERIFIPSLPTSLADQSSIKVSFLKSGTEDQLFHNHHVHPQQMNPNYISQEDYRAQVKVRALTTNSGNDQSKIENVRCPKYKNSMEAAFNEGNLLKHTNFAPTQRPTVNKEKRTRVPHRPAPPPPVLKTNIEENEDTDIQQLLSNLDIKDDRLHSSQSELQNS